MELRMKCFNILVVHEKIKFLGQGSHKKTISREDCLKWQAWNKLYLSQGAWQEKGGGGGGLMGVDKNRSIKRYQ